MFGKWTILALLVVAALFSLQYFAQQEQLRQEVNGARHQMVEAGHAVERMLERLAVLEAGFTDRAMCATDLEELRAPYLQLQSLLDEYRIAAETYSNLASTDAGECRIDETLCQFVDGWLALEAQRQRAAAEALVELNVMQSVTACVRWISPLTDLMYPNEGL